MQRERTRPGRRRKERAEYASADLRKPDVAPLGRRFERRPRPRTIPHGSDFFRLGGADSGTRCPKIPALISLLPWPPPTSDRLGPGGPGEAASGALRDRRHVAAPRTPGKRQNAEPSGKAGKRRSRIGAGRP